MININDFKRSLSPGNTDPKMAAYVNKLKMIKQKAKPKHKAPYPNSQFEVGGVAFTGGSPHYLLTSNTYKFILETTNLSI